MIPAASVNSFASFGMSGGGKCTMKSASHLQQLFLGKIYKNPLHAMVRELWLNALDSMIQAGLATMPIHVSLPSVFSPVYVMRDFGVGMTHDQFEETYSDLGGSTKRQDSSVTGSLGLGSKSPLGYADLFNVSCYDGETVRHYLISKDIDGDMIWVPVSSGPSDEPRGVEVSVPIKETDFDAVARHYREISSTLNHPNMPEVAVPLVNGVVPEDYAPDRWDEYPLTTPTVSLVARQNLARGGYGQVNCKFWMGHIAYKVDLSAMLENLPKHLESSKSWIKATAEVVNIGIFAPMDAADGRCPVDFDAGRYNIQSTERSATWVVSELAKACDVFWQQQVDQLKASVNLMDRWRRIIQADAKYSEHITNYLVNRAGMLSDYHSLIPLYHSPLNVLLAAAGEEVGLGWNARVCGADGNDMHRVVMKRSSGRLRGYERAGKVRACFLDLLGDLEGQRSHVVIVDDPSSWRQRYENVYGHSDPVFVLNYERSIDGKVCKRASAEAVERLCHYLEDEQHVLVLQTSSLPKLDNRRAVKLKRRAEQFGMEQCYHVNSHNYGTPSYVFAPVGQAFSKHSSSKYLLIKAKGFSIETSPTSGWQSMHNGWHEALEVMTSLDRTRSDSEQYRGVLAYRPSEVKSAAIPEQCRDMFDYIDEQYEWYMPIMECLAIERTLRKALDAADVLEIFGDAMEFGVGRPRIRAAIEWMESMTYLFRNRLGTSLRQAEKVWAVFKQEDYNRRKTEWAKLYEPICRNIVRKLLQQYPLLPVLPVIHYDGDKRQAVKAYPAMAHRLDRKDHLTAKDLPKIPVLPTDRELIRLVPALVHFVDQTESSYAGFRKRDKACKSKTLTTS